MTESTVYLRDGADGKLVQASLFDEITVDHLSLWRQQWIPVMQSARSSNPRGLLPEDIHWDWLRKLSILGGRLGYHCFAIICRSELQGLMICNDMASARLPEQFGKALIYIDYLATAPCNRAAINDPPKYRGVGYVFVLAAIETSNEMGYKSRVGLHSLPGAELFYEQKCGFTRLGEDAAQQDLTYFEMTKHQAEAFRRNQRKQ